MRRSSGPASPSAWRWSAGSRVPCRRPCGAPERPCAASPIPPRGPDVGDPDVVRFLNAVHDVLGENLVGAYLFGSSVLGGLRPHSDIDIMVVVDRPTTREEKRALVGRLLEISGSPRPLELTSVVESDVKPWRYPPRMDFQYGDWWRKDFERGDLEPWGSPVNPDLASLIRMVLASDTPLLGPPPGEIFDPIPRDDYAAALIEGIDGLLRDIEGDTRNVLLTFARIWSSLVTDEVWSKDAAAGWVLARIPAEHRSVLSEARDIYLGEREAWSEPPIGPARALAQHMSEEISRVRPDLDQSP